MKSTRTNGAKWLIVSVLAAVSICGIPQAHGADWQNAGGGWYGIGGNWNPGVPPADGEANFAIGGAATYTVNFSDNESCDIVNVYSLDDVTFNLNGYEYAVYYNIDSYVQIGSSSDGSLTVTNGQLTMSGGLYVGDWQQNSSFVAIESGGQVSAGWAGIQVGDDGAIYDTNVVNTVDGFGSSLDISGQLRLGRGGVDGIVLAVTNDATMSIGGGELYGGLQVDGTDSAFAAAGYVSIGQWEDGRLKVTAGGEAAFDSAQISGAVTVDGVGGDAVGSSLTFADWGDFNASLLEITNGGRLTADSELDLVNDTMVRIDGAGSILACGGTVWVEDGAMLEVTDGGSFITDELLIDEDSGVRVALDGTLDVGGALSVVESGLLLESGSTCLIGGEIKFIIGQFSMDSLVISPERMTLFDSDMSASGQVIAPFGGDASSTVTATGNLTIGDGSKYDGFNHAGRLSIGAHDVTLDSKGFASLGVLTEIDGGTLTALNGVAIGSGENLVGSGEVVAPVAAGFGSVIEATGNLGLGDDAALDGFQSDGVLTVGDNTVTLYDANQAVLGSLTQLGSAGADGTLVAANGLVVEFGKNITGRGVINTPDDALIPLINNGAIIGESPGAIDLAGYVKGVGTLENVTVSGTLSPGFSPVRLGATNLDIATGGTLLMELGGLSGGSQYDQLDVAGTLTLGGSLQVTLIDGFMPGLGDSFDILDWDSLAGGAFDSVDLPELTGRNAWDESKLYDTGVISVVEMLAGDTNLDWTVDDSDMFAFADEFGAAGDRYTDFNEDGRIDLVDFIILRENFGVGPAPEMTSASSTPEPVTMILLAAGVPVLFRRRRKLL